MTRKLKAVKGRPVVIKNIINRTAHDLSGKALTKAQCSDVGSPDPGVKLSVRFLFTKAFL
jgi:hypothetical protein